MQSFTTPALLATAHTMGLERPEEMVIYYRGQVLITHEVFETRWPDHRRFHVARLLDVHVTRGCANRAMTRSFGATGALLVVALAGWPLFHLTGVLLVVGLLLATFGVVGGAYYRRSQPSWELRATYDGESVELFSTTDLQTFGQVRRALIRALEANVR
jgi:hypothetical protein